MPSDLGPPVTLTVTNTPKEANLVVYDSDNREIATHGGAAELTFNLPRGFYTIRVNLGADFDETFVRLDGPMSMPAPIPTRYSSAPITISALTHEYYSETSRDWSRQKTRGPLSTSALPSAELFVFVRAIDRERYKGADLGQHLQLLDTDGVPLSDFSDRVTRRDREFGWLSLCAEAAPGFYRLRASGDRPREFGLYLLPNWQTQLFVIHHERPLIEGLRAFMSPVGTGFDPGDDIAAAVDAGLSALQSESTLVPEETLDLFLHNKFKNPMLGFIGAHLLIRAARSEPVNSAEHARRVDLLGIVLKNLAWLAPGAPDTEALNLIAAHKFHLETVPASLPQPPMLRAGLSAALVAATENPFLIPGESLSDRISDRLLEDSPWTTWEPLPSRAAISSRRSIDESARGGIQTYTYDRIPEVGLSVGRATEIVTKIVNGVVEFSKVQSIRLPWLSRVREFGWLEYALIDHVVREAKRGKLSQGALNVTDIAKRLRVTPHAIDRAVRRLDRLPLRQILSAVDADDVVQAAIGRWNRFSELIATLPDARRPSSDRLPPAPSIGTGAT